MSAQSSRPIGIGPIHTVVGAPAALVFQMLGAIGQGTTVDGEHTEILSNSGDTLIADFWTRVPLPVIGSRLLRTREEVRLRPPGRIDYRHLDGPLRDLHEQILTEAVDERSSRLSYRATFVPGSWVRRAAFRLMAPILERTMLQHFDDLRTRAEARASRSRVFRVLPDTEIEAEPAISA